jgi:DNA polymerase-3 subunit beta
MKVMIAAKDLANALAAPVRWAKGEGAARGVLIEAIPEVGLKLVGTDSTTAVRTNVAFEEAYVSEAGTVLVSARRLYDLVRALQPETITLHTTDANLGVTGGNFEGRLSLMPVGNFPALKDVAGRAVVFSVENFKKAAEQVLPAVSADPRRKNHQGVLVRVLHDVIVLAATDGVRVAESRVKIDEHVGEWEGRTNTVVLPPAVIAEATRGSGNGVLTYSDDNSKVGLATNGLWVSTSPLAIDFPDYSKFMSTTYDMKFEASRQGLLTAIGRVNLLADDIAAVRLNIGDDRLVATLKAAAIGEAHESVSLDTGEAEFESAFNPAMLLAGLQSAGGETVFIHANQPLRPVLFTDGNGYKYLLMPVRVAKPGE